MGKRNGRLLWISSAVLAVIVPLAIAYRSFQQRPVDPVYGGIPLSEHLGIIYGPRPQPQTPGRITPQDMSRMRADSAKRIASQNALCSDPSSPLSMGFPSAVARRSTLRVGPEALPLITQWLATPPPSGWRLALAKRLSFVFPKLALDRRMAAWAFLANYPIADDPKLSIFMSGMNDTNRQVQGAAARALVSHIESGMKVDKDFAIRCIFPLSSYSVDGGFSETRFSRTYYSMDRPMQENFRNIVDGLDPTRDLIPLFTLEMGATPARVGAAHELTGKPRYPERAVPLLIANLTSTNRAVIEACVEALGAYGPASESALPELAKLLNHSREPIRIAASNAVATIGTKASIHAKTSTGL